MAAAQRHRAINRARAGLLATALLSLALPPGAAAQPMTCMSALDDDPRLAPAAAALDRLDTILPSLRDTLADTVAEICLADPPFGAQGYFEPSTRRLVLSSALPDGLMQAVFFHELRHARQFSIASCPPPGLSMQEHAEAIFAMEADASVSALVIADALRKDGAPDMWQALADWPQQADVTAAFAATLADTRDLASAASAAFDAWYANPDRVADYYVAACLDYLEQEDRTHTLPRYESLDPAFFGALCHLPGGAPYACVRPADE